MRAMQQPDSEDIKDRVLRTLNSIVHSLGSLRALISSLPQTEGDKFQAVLTETLSTCPFAPHTPSMSRATSDDQLKFLLSCVRYSNNGKVDFVEVAKECGIVSKGAAAKRYERLLRANGIHPNGGPTESPARKPTNTPVNKKSNEVQEKPNASRKRKADVFEQLPPSKSTTKNSSQTGSVTMPKTDASSGSTASSAGYKTHVSRYEPSALYMPSPPPLPHLPPRQMPAQMYHNPSGMMSYHTYQGLGGMAPSHFSTATPSSMSPMLSSTRGNAGLSTGQFTGGGSGLQEYLSSDMFYHASMPHEVQLNPSLLNDLGPSPLRIPPRPASVVQGSGPDSDSLSLDTKSESQSHTGSILIVD
ncbi:hypothetical protein LTR84_004189 [Exophiala bonariae]|uniref:Myb-like DNA-binding domain-containing protein n=1 Tax=Exophiala bonariae TaxID=1690606 RepID=A0AAV9N9N8_9EURO|nr:hypothetical protein LTR84_004189 [Exophiala bonariae]